MDLLSNIEVSFGVFSVYAMIVGLVVMLFTFFVNFVRGIAMTILGISLLYYSFIATPQVKIEMDNYMKNLVTSVSGGTVESVMSNVNDIKDNVSRKIADKITGMENL